MPVLDILGKRVEGRQIEATAKPPDRLFAFLLGNEEADVGVAGRHIGVMRMDHQRHAHRLELATGQLWPMGCSRGRHGIAIDMGEVDAPCSITAP